MLSFCISRFSSTSALLSLSKIGLETTHCNIFGLFHVFMICRFHWASFPSKTGFFRNFCSCLGQSYGLWLSGHADPLGAVCSIGLFKDWWIVLFIAEAIVPVDMYKMEGPLPLVSHYGFPKGFEIICNYSFKNQCLKYVDRYGQRKVQHLNALSWKTFTPNELTLPS